MRVRQSVVCALACLGLGIFNVPAAHAQLTAPWANTDIGSPAAAGSAAESGGTYTVRGAGSDIWFSSDQFHFVYQPISGNVDLRAHVAAVEYVQPWTKAGVMIRETLGPTSRHASTFVTPAKGLVFQRRILTGGESLNTLGATQTAPYWVRIVRAGDLFTSYISPDGDSWTLVGSETIAMSATIYVGLVVVSKDQARTAMATFTDVSVSGPSEPPPASTWANQDVGSPALAGRASESGGTFSLTGGGTDIWNTADQFHFMYQPADGDLEIVARVATLDRAHDWSKAGVMIREALTAASAHAFMAGTSAKGWAFQRRPLSGAQSIHSPGTFTAPPGWVRLVRSGDTFSGYESTDGTNWTLVGTETIPMSSSVYVGLAVTSHNVEMTSTATFSNVSVTTAAPSNQAPTVTLTAPANGTTYTAPATITLSASASDADGTIAKVEFFADGQSLGSDTQAPFGATWNAVPAGTHNLSAIATDDGGLTATSGVATVTVNAPPNQPPTVSITSPANGATFIAPAAIAVNASAADSDGTVAAVDFFANGQPLGTDTTSPYSVSWTNVAAGSYSLTAVARDSAGATTTSTAVAVTVTSPPLPSGWTSQDIGSPALAGSSSFTNGVFTISGAGVDIWNTADQFRYVYQTMQGDLDITARVDTLQGPVAWSKGGVMIRESLSADSPNVYVAATGGNGWTFQRRLVAGGISYAIPVRPPGTAPGWVRLVRTGTEFRGYYSADGSSWTLLGTDTIAMPSTVYVGLAVTSHDATARATATLSNVTIGVPVSNQPPTVSITSPTNGAGYTAPGGIVINAIAADSDGTVAAVDFFANGQPIGTDTTSPYSVPWNNVPVGTHSLTAVARDDAGTTTTSAAVSVTVVSGPTPTPTTLVFTASADHDTAVTSYFVAVYRDGDPVSAAPMATKDLGKPTPSDGDITSDISDIVNPLAAGAHYAVVTAIGPGGSSASAPSASFNR